MGMGGFGNWGPGNGGDSAAPSSPLAIPMAAQAARQAGAAPPPESQPAKAHPPTQMAYRAAVVAPLPFSPSIAAFAIKLGVIISVIHIIVVKSFWKVMIECFEDMISSRV